jgi:plasmid stabilization system protein ParE
LRYTPAAREDIHRLYAILLGRDMVAAERALAHLDNAVDMLQWFPLSCRKADPDNPLLRELVVSFGSAGYVMVYEIEDDQVVNILAVRHQREDDYR